MIHKLLFVGLLLWAMSLMALAQDDEIRRTRRPPAQTPKPAQKSATTPGVASKPTQTPGNVSAFVKGVISDGGTKEPLGGVYLQVEGTMTGTLTNDDGQFTLPRLGQDSMVVYATFVGYERQRIVIMPNLATVNIIMKEQVIMANEVVVSASRVSERVLESPVTVEKLDIRGITESPSLNAYETVLTLKGVDQLTSSNSFRVMNTRGFNSISNTRFVQRVDGVNLEAPGFNFPIGVLNGPADLDVESMELIPGVSSALYGPNAFNGLLEVKTKSPFIYTGASASIRTGVNHVDGIDTRPQPFLDFGFRFADSYKDKFAWKVNLVYNRNKDWFATDYRDFKNYRGTDNLTYFGTGPGNPGYDGLNMYGDEVASNFQVADPTGQMRNINIARTGYQERDVANYDSYFYKLDLGAHYRITKRLELSGLTKFVGGTTVYQGSNRNMLVNFRYNLYKLELNGPQFFIRTYASFESAGDSYDSRFVAFNLNRAAKQDVNWFSQYLLAFNPQTNPLLNAIRGARGLSPLRAFNDQDARNFADGDNQAMFNDILMAARMQLGFDSLRALGFARQMTDGRGRLQPGTEEFRRTKERLTTDPDPRTGAKFIDETRFYHAEGQYDFSKLIPWAEVIAGGSYRLFDLRSDGTIFSDTTGRLLTIYELGAYIQVTKRFFNDRIRLSGSIRGDKNQNFDPQYSPRVAAVLRLDDKGKHFVRSSYQTGFRMPTLQNQYIDLDLGPLMYISGLEGPLRANRMLINHEGNANFVNAFEESSALTASQANDSTLLRRIDNRKLRPEYTWCYEIGYKGLILNDKLLFDINYYYSGYQDFIVTQALVGPNLNNITNGELLTFGDIRQGNIRSYRRAVNYNRALFAHGFSMGTNYSLTSQYSVSANYTYSELISSLPTEDNLVGFNTPRNKVNLGVYGRNLFKRFGFAVTYKWNDAMFYQEVIATGTVPAFHLIDTQISYRIPSIKTQFRVGGTNVMNNRYIEALGGPTIGSMLYFQVTFDQFLN
jgi:iron complex outermembrane recepter protein